MNSQNPNQRQKKGNPGGRGQGGGQGGGKGGGQGGGKGGGKKRGKKRGKKKQNNSAIDSKRPLWENPPGEAEVREVVGLVRPAHHPTAVVRSLGDPPLGKYASSAQHYYDAVYDKAQQFAVAVAAANGVLDTEDDEDPTEGMIAEAPATDSSDEA